MSVEIYTQYILKNNVRSEVKIKRWPKIKRSCNGKLDQEELWPLKNVASRKTAYIKVLYQTHQQTMFTQFVSSPPKTQFTVRKHSRHVCVLGSN